MQYTQQMKLSQTIEYLNFSKTHTLVNVKEWTLLSEWWHFRSFESESQSEKSCPPYMALCKRGMANNSFTLSEYLKSIEFGKKRNRPKDFIITVKSIDVTQKDQFNSF